MISIIQSGCPIEAPESSLYRLDPAKTAAICKLSNHVMRETSLLAQYASRYSAAVSVVSSSIDLRQYSTRGVEDAVRMVTFGPAATAPLLFLEELSPVPLLRRFRPGPGHSVWVLTVTYLGGRNRSASPYT
jgi:hypothetical protein